VLATASAGATTHPTNVQPRNRLITMIAPKRLAWRTRAITVGRRYISTPTRANSSRKIVARLPSRPQLTR
jgi:hypothetical protein